MFMSVDIGFRHLAWVVFRSDPLTYVDGGVDEICTRKKPTTEMVVHALTDWIHTGPPIRYAEATILCESQVGPAVKNRVLAFVLLSHWAPRPFIFITSSAKVRGMPAKYFPPTVDQATILKECYSRRKNASVRMTRHIIAMHTRAAQDAGSLKADAIADPNANGMRRALATMEGMDKKDDFGDAFVQGIYFLSREVVPPKKRTKK